MLPLLILWNLMPSRFWFILVPLALAAFPVAAQPVPLGGLDAYIAEAMEAWEVPGLALSIVRSDSVLLAAGYGVINQETGVPVDADTRFAIGSNTKAMTATALGLLVEDGRLAWDDRTVDRLDGFRLYDDYATTNLTITDLLSHRSGLSTWAGELVAWGSSYSRDEVLHRLRHLEPGHGFREEFGYSNMMFLAAGQVIPAVTDTTWDTFVKARLLDPIGMGRTVTSPTATSGDPNVATPYERIDGAYRAVPHRNIDNLGPAGSVYSTASDMARWVRFQLGQGTFDGQTVADTATVRRTWTPVTVIGIDPLARGRIPSHLLSYGLGWQVAEWRGWLLIFHSGAVDGMYSQVAFLPEKGVGVVVLTNAGGDHQLNSALTFEVLDRLLPDASAVRTDWSATFLAQRDAQRAHEATAETPRVEGTHPSHLLAAYTGRYEHPMYGSVEVVERIGGLVVRLLAHDIEGPLVHHHYDAFRAKWSDPTFGKSLVTFALGENGDVSSFEVQIRPDWIDPLTYTFKRVVSAQ
jgi:CubicO group peptidase (beta-lactamase class C family)